GGLIAAMVAARNPRVAFVINMAGPAVRGYDVLVVQAERLFRSLGLEESQITRLRAEHRMTLDLIAAGNWAVLEAGLYEQTLAALRGLPEEQRRRIGDLDAAARTQTHKVLVYFRGWVQFFITHDPGQDWARVKSPVLSLFGVLDVQVDWKQNGSALEAALGRALNHDVTTVIFPRANHLFQDAVTGSTREYASLRAAFVPAFLPTISAWLSERFGVRHRPGPVLDRHLGVR
ncbi:MAG: hypothetical protein ACRDGN_16300, partial [bacterium]